MDGAKARGRKTIIRPVTPQRIVTSILRSVDD